MEALQLPIDFRPALAADAQAIARFFQLTSEGMADYIWSKLAAPGEALLSVGTARYAREQGDFSYKNCLMATAEGQVIGMMHSYALRHNAERHVETDPVLAPYADMEIPDTLYISSLALEAAWRNQGLGARFLQQAQQRADALGLQGLCLIDYAENTGARRFYERQGFQIVKTCQIVPHPMLGVTGDAYLMHRPNHAVLPENQP
jgi:ribosomal protein S18 acetylase RimI-like enzyme